jgi:hypothetical protein
LKENKRMQLGAFQHMNVRDVEALWRYVHTICFFFLYIKLASDVIYIF